VAATQQTLADDRAPRLDESTMRNMQSLLRPLFSHRLAAACACALLLAACGGGGGGEEPAGPAAAPTRGVERLATPWSEAGRALTLEVVVHKPAGTGPWPTLVFHHGSTGNGDNPALFTQTFDSPSVAQAFTARGWMVLFPQRRGRGASDGLYDEGFESDRSRYSCREAPALQGFARALEDAVAITDAVLARSDVDRARLVVGGHSRGGALALAHAALRPAVYRGVLNFTGGWLGQGCVDALPVSVAIARQAASRRTDSLWLYGSNDPFYSLNDSRAMFDLFVASGGQGQYRSYQRADSAASGHLIHQESALWRDDVARWVDALR
jgi:dienelactone hydrolase